MLINMNSSSMINFEQALQIHYQFLDTVEYVIKKNTEIHCRI